MRADIATWYNKPSCFFKYEFEAMKFLMDQVNIVLAKYPLPKVKSEILEILLCNDGTERFEVIKCSTGRGKYLTYQFWLPYPLINKGKETQLEPFIHYIFEGLTQALLPFGLPENEIREAEKIVKNEIVGNKKYEYVPSRDELVMEIIIAGLKEKHKNNPNVII
jgi:hypothetical protein